ncbi:hypothetical protein ACIPF8_01315 [Collimonas sp. NPDC087041]|uniref:hypothetical protein n=1 Tax=Collimonas sp. NPDC087041 TaxID=3363960 RepID=UPI0037F71A01
MSVTEKQVVGALEGDVQRRFRQIPLLPISPSGLTPVIRSFWEICFELIVREADEFEKPQINQGVWQYFKHFSTGHVYTTMVIVADATRLIFEGFLCDQRFSCAR